MKPEFIVIPVFVYDIQDIEKFEDLGIVNSEEYAKKESTGIIRISEIIDAFEHFDGYTVITLKNETQYHSPLRVTALKKLIEQ